MSVMFAGEERQNYDAMLFAAGRGLPENGSLCYAETRAAARQPHRA